VESADFDFVEQQRRRDDGAWNAALRRTEGAKSGAGKGCEMRRLWSVGEVHSFHRRRRFFLKDDSLVEEGQIAQPLP